MDERLKQQLEFVLEIDKEKNIFRQTHLSGQGRNENDAEHAWHMANHGVSAAGILQRAGGYRTGDADVLIHDIVEIDAGDTYAYDADGLKTQKAREDAAKGGFFPCSRKIRSRNWFGFSMSSKHFRRRRRNLPVPWITCSHCY